MPAPKIAFICASLRRGSINKMLERALIHSFAKAGADCTAIDLANYELPLFHGELDTPPAAKALIETLLKFDGVMIISPEYNGGLPPLLKNMIDWTSTIGTAHIQTPYYGIASCTPGPMSGIMCMRQINYILTRLGAHVSPFQVGVGYGEKAFNGDGDLISDISIGLSTKLIDDMLAQISAQVRS